MLESERGGGVLGNPWGLPTKDLCAPAAVSLGPIA